MNPTNFLAIAPAMGTFDSYFTLLQTMINTGNAPNGDTWGHYILGWDDADLDNQQISASYFVNAVQGYFTSATPIASVTQSQVTNAQSTSVTGQATSPASTTNTTNTSSNVSTPAVGSAIIAPVVSTVGTTTTATSSCFSLLDMLTGGSSDLCIGPVGLSTIVLLGGLALIMFSGSESGHRR
jgi:hypothetical protein